MEIGRLTKHFNKYGRHYCFNCKENIPMSANGNFITRQCLDKLGQLEDIEEWFEKKTFYGKALNKPNKILILKFEKLDFIPEEDLLLIHFEVLNSYATNIIYNIFDYGKTWALTKEELE